MKITSLEIERFGLWSGLTLPQLSDGINVFYGANEAGKSTLMEFIRAALYGFSDKRKHFVRNPTKFQLARANETPNEQSQFLISGGLLQMESPSGQYLLRRTFLPDRIGNEDQIEIQGLDGTKHGSQFLRVLVSGVDEQTFNNVFAIGLDELQRLASLNDTDAAEMLFRLSVGMDRVAIVDTIKELSARRNRILNIAETEGKPSHLTQLLARREKILEELAETKNLVRQYVGLKNEQRVLDRSVANLEEDHLKLQKEKRLYEIAKHADAIWERRHHIREDIDAMGTVTAVSEPVVQQLGVIETELTERHTAFEKVWDEYKKAKKAITSLPISEKITQLAPRIEILLEDEERIIELDKEISDLETEIDRYNKRINEEETQLRHGAYPLPGDREPGTVSPESGLIESALLYNDKRNTVQASVLEEYRSYAKAVNHSRKRLARSQHHFGELQRQVKELNERVKTELAKRETQTLTEAVEKASEMVTQLRRRQTIGQKINDMMTHHKELRRINAFLMQNQALPGWMLALMILSALAGITCIVMAFIPRPGFNQSLMPVFFILGILMIVVPFIAKKFTEKNNAKKLEDNQQQLGALTAQLDRAKQDAAAIDARFPYVGSAPIEVRVQEAQQELNALEKLMPLETQRNDTTLALKQTELRVQQSKEAETGAIKRWNDWLRRTGLPSDWTPARIRDYLDHCDVVGDLKKELDKRCDTVNQRIKDIKVITNRVDNLLPEIELTVSDGASYVEILSEIRKKLDENKQAIQKRDKLVKGMKEFRKMRRKVVADLDKAKQKELDLLRQFGVKTPDELHALHARHVKHRRMLTQEQNVQRELEAAMGHFCSEPTLGNLLEPRLKRKLLEQQVEAERVRQLTEGIDVEYIDETLAEELAALEPLPELDDLLKDVIKRIEIASAKLHEELQNRGQLTEQIKRVAEDQTATVKQRELAVVNEKIRAALSDWQVYAVCAKMLDEIRSSYERDRQPRTLAEASEFLKLLTEGKYCRIWTPLGDETLLVDDQEGNTFDVAWLSRGTREQLFIALRLALASEFARHGSILPLILDDVFVNFDSQRAWSAIKVLLEVAASGTGRQVLLFTCHEHICRMFQKMDVPVRILPPVEDPGRPIRVLLPRSIIERRRKLRLRRQQQLESERTKRRIADELALREESIRLDAIRRAEVQRLIVQMQQQATAEKAFEADQKGRTI